MAQFEPRNLFVSLVALYESTNGTGWAANEAWLRGVDPCAEAWHGVACCPVSAPWLDPASGGCTSTVPGHPVVSAMRTG